MFERRLTRTYVVPVSAAEAWAYLSDPVALAAASSHPVRVVKTDPGMAVGTTWVDHHGIECDFDAVPWRVTAVQPGRSLTVEGLQAGCRQRVTTRLEPGPTGVEVGCTLALRPSLRARGTLVERVLLWLMLATGLGLSIVAEQFDETVDDDRRHLDPRGAGEDPGA